MTSNMSKFCIENLNNIIHGNETQENIDIFLQTLTQCVQNEKNKTYLKNAMSQKFDNDMDNFMCLCKIKSEKLALKLIDLDCVTLTNRDKENFTCLTWSIYARSEALIYRIIEMEPSLLEIPCSKLMTPIIYAIRFKMYDVVIYMLEKNKNLFNYIDESLSTPFIYLIDTSFNFIQDVTNSVNKILSKLATNLQKNTLSDISEITEIKSFNSENTEFYRIFNYLIDNNIELRIEQANSNGDTALIFSIFVLNEDLSIKLFNMFKERCNLCQLNKANESALSFAVRSKFYKLTNLILDSDIQDVGQNSLGERNLTPLISAIMNNKEDIALKILNRTNIILEVENSNGETALYLAVKNKMSSLVLRLLELGAEFDYEYDGESPFMIACKNRMENVALKMYELKRDLYWFENDNFDKSSVYWICKNGLLKIGKVFFDISDKKVFKQYEPGWRNLLRELKMNDPYDEYNNYFIHHIEKEILVIDQEKLIQQEIDRLKMLEHHQKLIEEFDEEKRLEEERKLKKQMKKKASKEKAKARKVEQEEKKKTLQNSKNSNSVQKPTNPNSKVQVKIDSCRSEAVSTNLKEDTIQVLDSNIELNIDLIQSPKTIKVKSPIEQPNLSIQNVDLSSQFDEDISQLLNKKYQLENWYFELEKINF